VINEVVAGVLTDAITAAGRRVAAAMPRPGRRHLSEALAIARWFDTYQLTESIPELPELSPEETTQLAEVLRGDEVQAVLHELLAARLTDAPETDMTRVRATFDLTLRVGDPGIGQLAVVLFDYYDAEICELVGRLESAEPATLDQIRSEAAGIRMIAILHAIERHTSALSGRPAARTETDFLFRYQRHVAEHHGKIEPPDFDRRRRIPIGDLYVPPAIVQVIDTAPGEPPREISLRALDDEIDRTVLLGDPGGGKTTAANYLMHQNATDAARPVPFLVILREFAAPDGPERSVLGHIEHKLETFYQCSQPPGIVAQLLLTGRALVIFDGLDELLDSTRRAEVTAIIERFAAEYPLVRLLVTSRLVGYDQAWLDDRQFALYRIGELTSEQIISYANKWFMHDDGIDPADAGRWAATFIEESATAADLLRNPLMLALMCILYRGEGSLPRNRAEVYEQCANLLFRKWDARRRIHLELRAGHLLEPVLRHIAWWLFTENNTQSAVIERELINQASVFLYDRGLESEGEAKDAAGEFVKFCKGRMWVFTDVGTTPAGEPLYAFTHRTFLEYFAAAQLAFGCDTPELLARKLAPRIARREWEVVGELAVQIKDHTSDRGAQRIFSALLDERRRRSSSGRSGVLEFLARCLRSADPSPQAIRRLTRQVLDHFFAGDTNNKTYYMPLSWLLGSCANCRENVNAEIGTRIDAMIGSATLATRVHALQLAVGLADGVSSLRDDGPRMPNDSALASFWRTQASENAQKYTAAIIDTARHDIGICHRALTYNIIDVKEALKLFSLTDLFQSYNVGVFDSTWAAYLPTTVTGIVLGWKDQADELAVSIDELAEVGRYLTRYPQPPWVSKVGSSWTEFFWGHPKDQDILIPDPDPLFYLGAAAVTLIFTEHMKGRVLPEEGPQRFGVLSSLYPYIEQRWNIKHHSELPDLPVPSAFHQVFRDWAYNKIDLIEYHS